MTTLVKPWLEFTSLSDVGRKRAHNEDSTGSDTRTKLVVLADGMGGYEAGELASALAVAHVVHAVRRSLGKQARSHSPPDDSRPRKGSALLRNSITQANQNIYKRAKSNRSFKGMGTTLVAALFYPDRSATVAHVGDSRMYRLRGPEFKQVTRDHSLQEDLVERGLCSREEAAEMPNKHLVTRALGKEAEVKVAVQEITTEPGDLYLLCSDGLTDLVNDREILLTLQRFNGNLKELAEELVEKANTEGGKDNISVILARILPAQPETGRPDIGAPG